MILTPYFEVYNPNKKGDDKWISIYLFSTIENMILIIPLIILLILTPKVRKKKIRRIMVILLLITGLMASLVSIQMLVLPIQDFHPRLGVFLQSLLLPIVMISSWMEWSNKV